MERNYFELEYKIYTSDTNTRYFFYLWITRDDSIQQFFKDSGLVGLKSSINSL